MYYMKKILTLNFAAATCSIVQVLSACLSEMKKQTLPTLTSFHGSGIMQWLLQDEHSSDED